MPQCSLAPLDGVPDRVQQHVVAEWLGQKFHSARLHGLYRHGHIAVACDEYDWHVNPFDSDALLQIETVKARKRNVQYEAARNEHAWVSKEFLCRGECLRLPTLGANQQLQRLTNGDVVINNEYDGCCRCHR